MTIFSLLTYFFLLTSAAASAAADDSIFLDCGVSGSSTTFDGRNWTGDAAATTFTLTSGTLSLPANSPVSPAPATPYHTARVSASPFTYHLPVTQGRKFLRLHFFPVNYGNFASSDALFTVTAGPYTLLKNFNASQTVEFLGIPFLVREYSINISFLNLTFTPSSALPASYAFVNAIEIISSPDIFSGGNRPQPYSVEPDRALQTMYRLNVGGQVIRPMQDSGSLFRTWEDDSPYIHGAGIGVAYAADENVTIRYPANTPEYIAPADVYATARSMGPNPSINLNYNLTWILPVDPGFYYLVRLHFCEISYSFTEMNQRVFDIFINNHAANKRFNVIRASGGIGLPVYQDFFVVIPNGSEREKLVDLWVSLHPAPRSKPEVFNAILNGLEVFKLQSYDATLAGLNPTPSRKQGNDAAMDNAIQVSGNSRRRIRLIAAFTGGGLGLLLSIILFTLFSLLQKGIARPSSMLGSSALAKGSSTPCRHFSFAELEHATNGFDEAVLIGAGGFGKVYRGTIDSGLMTVAIKRGRSLSGQGIQQFYNEIETLSKLQHHHLVSLIGYCHDSAEMILVYNFMSQGNLGEHLYGTKDPLPWRRRLQICIGAARGLHYLHTGANPPIIHRDVKTTNILLDGEWVAKVADFGLSRKGPEIGHSHVSSAVRGTMGYLDPEYVKLMRLTEKSDVYAFGVVMLEVLCGRPALDPAKAEEESLVDWVLQSQKDGAIDQVLDPYLKGKARKLCLEKFVKTAVSCVAEGRVERPAMGDVLRNLELALAFHLQECCLEDSSEAGHSF
ncbi:Receptor-like protein kinase FERONIA [Apostasia shenzhenica]|uniref:Receptor-like protein kinase FERONIA n=1 Tax=Apostasia shenzhenica TaxID=1088818 RepID=A0A2I0A4S6_9ASPA|nr:Receptor-like protein kinase FERONIA [Apostasia shenzhenica]